MGSKLLVECPLVNLRSNNLLTPSSPRLGHDFDGWIRSKRQLCFQFQLCVPHGGSQLELEGSNQRRQDQFTLKSCKPVSEAIAWSMGKRQIRVGMRMRWFVGIHPSFRQAFHWLVPVAVGPMQYEDRNVDSSPFGNERAIESVILYRVSDQCCNGRIQSENFL